MPARLKRGCSISSWAWRGGWGRRSSTAGRSARRDRLGYALGRGAGLRAAPERAGAEPDPGGLYRRGGDRAGDLRVLPGARDQPQAALRADRGQRLHHPAAGRRGAGRHRGGAEPGGGAEDRGKRRGLLPFARGLRRVLQEPGEHGGDQGRRGLGGDRGCRLHREGDRAPSDHRPGEGRGADGGWESVCAQVCGKQAEILSEHPGGGGVRGRAGDGLRLAQHRPERGRELGGAQQHRLWQLSGAGGAPARSMRWCRSTWRR